MNKLEVIKAIDAFADVSRETQEKLDAFVSMLLEANSTQNLISKTTEADVWNRHILDSAQLLKFAGANRTGLWLDIGSGAGLPGIVVAILSQFDVVCVEPRLLRCDFMKTVIDQLSLTNVQIQQSKIETVDDLEARIISARAWTSLQQIVDKTVRFADNDTRWILPKGASARKELRAIESRKVMFHVKQSLTDSESGILVGQIKKSR